MQILGAYAALTHQVDGTFASLYERDPAILLTHYAKDPCDRDWARWTCRRGTLRKLIELRTDVDIHILPIPYEAP